MPTYREIIDHVALLLANHEMDDYYVHSPGKFAGESIATIYAYDQMLAGCCDDATEEYSDEVQAIMDANDDEPLVESFMEIEFEPHEQAILRVKRWGYLDESDNGFVTLHEFDRQQKVCYFLDGHGCLTFEFRPVV